MAAASAGPYASLHLAPDRQPRQHPTTRFLQAGIGADFRFEVPGQKFSWTVIGGGRGQWLEGTMASAEHEPIMGVWGQSPQRDPGAGRRSPPEAESILVIGCPTEPANLAPFVKFSK